MVNVSACTVKTADMDRLRMTNFNEKHFVEKMIFVYKKSFKNTLLKIHCISIECHILEINFFSRIREIVKYRN